jgi:hypothetical protein
MSDYFWCNMYCSNPDVIKACVLAIRDLDDEQCKDWKDGDTEIDSSMNYYHPFNEIQQVSKQFADEVICCEYGSESSIFNCYTVKIRNGKFENKGIRPYYFSAPPPMNLSNEEDEKGILKKTGDILSTIDKIETDKNGKLFINWVQEEFRFRFEYDGEEGKKYMVMVTKIQGWVINFWVIEPWPILLLYVS